MIAPANAIASVSAALPSGTAAVQSPGPSGGFGELFGRALDQVDALQQRADQTVAQFVAGQGPDVHDVMIATQQAYLALQTVVQIRDRALAAYQDIMRMQI